MFWSNMVNPAKIERAAMDGTEAVTLFSSNLDAPIALAVDPSTDTLYWSDVSLNRIESSDIFGGNRRALATNGDILHPNGLAVLGNYIFWIDKETHYIEKMNKTNGGDRKKVQGRVSNLSDIIAVRQLTSAEISKNPCSNTNGGCSHICVQFFMWL